jgi:3',5'-cyclic AMP phosphodiesterase CpdA
MKTPEKSNSLATSRRRWLQMMGMAGATIMVPNWAKASSKVAAGTAMRSVRLAQISDIHLQPELGAAKGFAQCLRHIQAQANAPKLILNTGDSIMDSIATKEPRTKLQWNLWQKVVRDDCSLPMEIALGNHDYWGLDRAKSETSGSEPRWGKRWALDALELKSSYRSFDRFGWHFIVLDSVEPFQNGYRGRLGEEQLAWLKADLAATHKRTPILVMSHIPIVSGGLLLNDMKENKDHNIEISGGLMHLDAPQIHALFRQHGNVKLCLSGHLHVLDRVEYDGISYLTSGAVSSSWWKGIRLDRFDYGYALVDLFEDGSFKHEYVTYGWKTVAES